MGTQISNNLSLQILRRLLYEKTYSVAEFRIAGFWLTRKERLL